METFVKVHMEEQWGIEELFRDIYFGSKQPVKIWNCWREKGQFTAVHPINIVELRQYT